MDQEIPRRPYQGLAFNSSRINRAGNPQYIVFASFSRRVSLHGPMPRRCRGFVLAAITVGQEKMGNLVYPVRFLFHKKPPRMLAQTAVSLTSTPL
jgi:hypothetical protein